MSVRRFGEADPGNRIIGGAYAGENRKSSQLLRRKGSTVTIATPESEWPVRVSSRWSIPPCTRQQCRADHPRDRRRRRRMLPGCGRKRRGKRRASAVGGRSTSYQYAKCDSWWNRQYHHFPHALHALRPIETAKQICPPVAGRINQPAAGEDRDDAQENPTQTTTGRSNGIAR